MKTLFRMLTTMVSAGIGLTLTVSRATAGCGDLTILQAPFEFAQAGWDQAPSIQELPKEPNQGCKIIIPLPGSLAGSPVFSIRLAREMRVTYVRRGGY